MKRILTLTALIASLVVAATALAAPPRAYDGTIDEGGLMRLGVKTKANGQRIVKDFEFGKGVPTSCDEGDTSIGDHLVDASIPFYDKKHFRMDSELTEETTKIEGTRVSGHKIKGTLRWKIAELDPGHHNCDTGKLHWKATPTPPM